MIKLPKDKWAKFGLRLFLYIVICIVVAYLPNQTKLTLKLYMYVRLIAIFDLIFTYYGDYGPWKDDEDEGT
jgi:uncharacterized membrane protein YhdT